LQYTDTLYLKDTFHDNVAFHLNDAIDDPHR
jgi:hypothetical protein